MSSASAAGKLRLPAILFGWVTDVFGSSLAAIPLLGAFGVDPGDPAALDRLMTSTSYLVASLVVGLCFTGAGGFVAAHLARGEELNNAFVLGIVSAASSAILSMGSPLPLLYVAAGVVATVPAALLGGYLRARTRA